MKQLQKIEHFRRFVLKEINSLSTEQLNTVPPGLKNNIIWNLAHLVSASQMLFYKRAGLPVTIDEKYINPFLPATVPESFIAADEIDIIKELAITSLQTMQADYLAKDFSQYIKSENVERVYGIELLTIDNAVEFLLYHEGYHAGKIRAIKQLV